MNNCLSSKVPKPDASVVATRGDHARVKRKLRGSHPVVVAFERLAELALMHVPDLHQLIVRGRNKQASILVEVDRLYRCRVTIHDRAVSTCVIVPYTNGRIAGN